VGCTVANLSIYLQIIAKLDYVLAKVMLCVWYHFGKSCYLYLRGRVKTPLS